MFGYTTHVSQTRCGDSLLAVGAMVFRVDMAIGYRCGQAGSIGYHRFNVQQIEVPHSLYKVRRINSYRHMFDRQGCRWIRLGPIIGSAQISRTPLMIHPPVLTMAPIAHAIDHA